MSSQSLQVTPTSAYDSRWNINDSALDLLNAAIASHHQPHSIASEEKDLPFNEHIPAGLETKRETKDSPEAQTPSTKRRIGKTEQDENKKDSQQVPSTPKRPGRKPLEKTPDNELLQDPKQKRKAQNRAAQRAFRERKEKHVSELQERIRELEKACAEKDDALIQENKRLKEELKRLQEENYALKGTMFTFEFPVRTDTESSPPSTKGETAPSLSNHSFSSGNSCSGGEEGSSSTSSDHSPESHTAHEEDAVSSVFSSKDTVYTFGPLPREHDLDFLAVPGNGTPATPALGELFHGKDELFTGYRVPSNDDFLFDSEQLSSLFGTNDLFGFTTTAAPITTINSTAAAAAASITASTFNSDQQPFAYPSSENLLKQAEVPSQEACSYDVRGTILQAREQGRNAYELREQLEECPDFNLDMLCEDLRRKATCSQASYLLSDKDVDAFVKCFGSK
ncbi:hypothetical protein EC973_002874 [Apophysomyces ossiformis]|uniref:BZIP domain-containing protein n=1 Tax=Apophysomyces ossiformis TaxID=679940 RepID=A0A8H7BM43_9FUNG|nr:hypothetical protein EC973_002874 [Apophysomyces ossiformis]